MEVRLPAQSLSDDEKQWFVMRDLKRANAVCPAYKMLIGMGVRVYTPLHWKIIEERGRRVRRQIPFLRDLLFVYDTKPALDVIVRKTPTLQYRYVRGSYCCPMTVPGDDMQRFIHAVDTSCNPRFYLPEEIHPSMIGKEVRIVGGQLDGYEGHLLSIRGSRSKRLIINLPTMISACVEVSSEYIQFL